MAELNLTDSTFNEEVLQSPIPVVVDFWAEWCGPCKVLSPIVDQLAHEYEGKIKVAKLNVDDYSQIAMQYNVMSIPTLKFFKAGKLVGELIGAAPKATVEAEIKKYI